MTAYPPKADGSRQIKIESVPLPMFDGRTRSEEMEHRLAQWYQEQAAKGGDYAVCPRVEVNRAYSYGIGLFATVDYSSLNVQEVNEWIEDFRCRGQIASYFNLFCSEIALFCAPTSSKNQRTNKKLIKLSV